MKNNIEKTKKLSEAALAYITPALMAAIYDCSDSMKDEEKYENRFNALADDKFTISEYVSLYHLQDYADAIKEVAKDGGSEVSDWEEFLGSTPGCLPIPYEQIKDML